MSNRFTWDADEPDDGLFATGRLVPTADEIAGHADHTSDEVWDDCPICWSSMNPVRFVRHHLEGVTDVEILDGDATSWLVLITLNSQTFRAVVYSPRLHGLWEVEVEDEPYRGSATTWSQPDGCVDNPQKQTDTSGKPGSEVEPPVGKSTWGPSDMSVVKGVRPRTGFDPARDGCIRDQSPSPIERLLSKGDNE